MTLFILLHHGAIQSTIIIVYFLTYENKSYKINFKYLFNFFMIYFLLQGTFYDYNHDLTDFVKTSISIDENDHVTTIGLNSDGCYEVKSIENGHFGDLHTGSNVYGDRNTISNPIIEILPDDMNQPVIVNLFSNNELVQQITILPENFDSTRIVPNGYNQFETFEDYANNFGHSLSLMIPY